MLTCPLILFHPVVSGPLILFHPGPRHLQRGLLGRGVDAEMARRPPGRGEAGREASRPPCLK
eukprot:scaffold14778_cov109-Isochrysis_galbana.AAC.1